jgi:hypothetical protein
MAVAAAHAVLRMRCACMFEFSQKLREKLWIFTVGDVKLLPFRTTLGRFHNYRVRCRVLGQNVWLAKKPCVLTAMYCILQICR